MRRLLAIGFIWLCCAGAWSVLGSTLVVRSSTTFEGNLDEVRALWGPPLVQAPPFAVGTETHAVKKTREEWDAKRERTVTVPYSEDVTTNVPTTLARSEVDAALALEHRRKGLLWYPTYGVTFAAEYTFRNDTPEKRDVLITFPLEAGVTYDGFLVQDPQGTPMEVTFGEGSASVRTTLAAGEARVFTVGYKARGMQRWSYGAPGKGLGAEVGRARDFELTLRTDFDEIDFPAGALSPTVHEAREGRWSGTWRFDQLVSTATVAVELPQRLNPGPLASKITFFAPVSLLFFFFVTGMILAARRRSIHPMNYFLLGCAFFAFHLLFAYLIDHVDVGLSFAVASAVSVVLVVSYTRLFVGWRDALGIFGLSQLLYLVLFSFTFFWKGFTGLAIAAGAILTLFVIMQLTGKLDWEEVLRRPGERPPPAPPPIPRDSSPAV
ncbi:MAG TPA: inner membrane CreD family protein [Anaeromyxobacter sp.]|nr:inner membrane CreD family protein [Anaeromyxobacter sp.]